MTGLVAHASPALGEYVLLERIGCGGMAEVFRAERRNVGGFVRRVAIKKILPHLAGDEVFVRMFIDEARIAASLHHANIVSIHDLGYIDGRLCLVMELVEGKSLSEIFTQLARVDQPFYLRHALLIALDVCRGLNAAHARRVDGVVAPVVHRDVSPQNVLISLTGDVKISDFGVAKASGRLSLSEANMVKGKLAYVAPEVINGQDADTRADIFAVGIIMHEMLTGRRLFAGKTSAETLKNVLEMPIPVPSSVRPKLPPDVDWLVTKALARDPTSRYQKVADLARDISQFLMTSRLEATNAELGDFIRELFPSEKRVRRAQSEDANGLPDQRALQYLWDQINTTDARSQPQRSDALSKPLAAPSSPKPAQQPSGVADRKEHFRKVVSELAAEVRSQTDMGLWLQVALLAKMAVTAPPSGKRQAIVDGLVSAAKGNLALSPRNSDGQ